MQEKIFYHEIINLGFNEEFVNDNVYFKRHGYNYAIINKYLTKKIYLEWEKETKLCRMVRIDNLKECNILNTMPIMNLQHLKIINDFFCNKK